MPRFRPRLRFSLRTLFVLVTIVGCWFGYHLRWKNQRDDFLSASDFDPTQTAVKAPLALWLVGEVGLSHITLYPHLSDEDVAKVRRLFPEAHVERIVPWDVNKGDDQNYRSRTILDECEF